MRKAVERIWTRPRDWFSGAVLGTTSPFAPTLSGGLTFAQRAVMTALSIALATGLATLFASPLFYLPTMMIAAIFGGIEIAIAAFAVCLVLIHVLFPAAALGLLGAVAAIQVLMGLVMRQFFRESRRWGVRYRGLVGAIASAVTVSDAHGRIGRPHPDLGRLIGMDWPRYSGVGWLEAVHPDDIVKLPSNPHESADVYRDEIRLRDPRSGDWRWYLLRAVPMTAQDGTIAEWVSILSDIHERRLAMEQREILLGELRHRLKNLMAVVSSLATSAKPPDEPAVDTYVKKFLGRLHALTAAAESVLAGDQVAIEAGTVVRATLSPFIEENSRRFHIDGPRLLLSEDTGGALALGVHELATNAIKYGALSVPDGKVSLIWRSEPNGDGEQVTIEWTEQGGPPPVAPEREGFGIRVLKFVPAREKAGRTEIEYRPAGVFCRITFQRARQKELPAEPD